MKDVEKLPDAVIKGKRDFFSHFQKDDFDLLDGERPLFDWACKQTYIAMANMMTAAALLKIDSCPIEGFNRAAAEKILIDEGILDPVHFGISVMAGFGYRDEVQPVKTRLPASEVIEEI
jgi:nitroreductase